MNKTGILFLLAVIVTILELFAYGACFIGPFICLMAILHHQQQKKINGE